MWANTLPWLFIVVNRNLCIDFYKPFSTFGIFYCLLVRSIMSAVLFVVINCSSSFSAEKAENGEIAAQQILARVAVRVCMYVPVGENTFVLHVVVRVRGLEALITSFL